MDPNDRSRLIFAALAAILLIAGGCDSAFRSSNGSSESTPDFVVAALFDNGDTELQVSESGVMSFRLDLPSPGFDLVTDSGTIDPERLTITTNPPLASFSMDNLTPVLNDAGFIQIGAKENRRIPVNFVIPLDGPLEFPLGLMLWEITVRDDIGRDTAPQQLQLTVLAADRPTAVLRLETPSSNSLPTGLLLPTNDNGLFFVGEQLPFVLALEGIPNANSGAGFDLLVGNGTLNPERLIVVADRDLGDPGNGGYLAGENLVPLFGQDLTTQTDPQTGRFLAAASFALNGPASPPAGIVTFAAVVLDDDDQSSDPPQRIALEVVPPVRLSLDIQPIFSASCAIFPTSCHDQLAVIENLILSDPEQSHASLVGIPAGVGLDSCTPFRVDPYFPDQSYLLAKLRDLHDEGCVQGAGFAMPPLGELLPDEQILQIEQWIAQGAHQQ